MLKAREQNNIIIARYEAILAKIAEAPTNEADLVALRTFITDSKEKVQICGGEVNVHATKELY